MRKVILVTAAVLAAVIFFVAELLPPPPTRLPLDGVDEQLRRRTVTGAYHIHTTRSDGVDTKAHVAAAAARAGLNFAIFADHGDATRAPEPPAYIDGVLCLDGAEISTNGGHYVALGLSTAAPYPLGGEAAAVVEDVRRLGGFGIAAHPHHPRHQLAWDDWNAPIDGIEWLNADAEWRTEGRIELTSAVVSYLLRPAPAIAMVFDRPERTLERWDVLSASRRVIGLAAVDAHGAGRSSLSDQAEPRVAVGPSYEASFRSLSNRVVLERPFSGNAADDARLLLDAIRRGSVYSVIDAISPDVVVDPEGPRVVSPLPDGAEAVTIGSDGARRLEVRVPDAPGDPPVPWVVTNWVYARLPPASSNLRDVRQQIRPIVMHDWRIEKDPTSRGELREGAGQLTLGYTLGNGARNDQFVAVAADLHGLDSFDVLMFRARASKPMRVSVQLRFTPDDARWVKSIYLDTEEREVLVPLGEMAPAERPDAVIPPSGNARSLLFVVDLVNGVPGGSGEFTIGNIQVADR
jgi:hypothetical protein